MNNRSSVPEIKTSTSMAETSTPQTWLITGCSSGFGELFVRQLRAAGDNVIATGRNAETKLAHLKDTGASILDLDVAAPAADIDAKMAEAWNLYPGGIDVVVNNAGYILSATFEELT
jgi:NAD(P)-dependent dehydrogenase (short-subunit alcohol dehydrogenase family)